MSNTIKVTEKNITTKAVKELSLNEIVFQLAKKLDNSKIFELLKKAKINHSKSSVLWYASKSRSGVRR